jgi:hypothetical protein
MIKSDQNDSYIFVPAGNMLFSRIIGSFSLLQIPNFILGDGTASEKGARFCGCFGGETINSLNSLNGANSTCPAHPESYRHRVSPRSGFFRVDAHT